MNDRLSKVAGNRYFDRHTELWATKILPGEYHVTVDDELVVTTLGSCIAACCATA